MDGKLLRGKHEDKGDFGLVDLIGFFLKVGQGDKILRVENEEFDQVLRVGDSCLTDSTEFLLKLE